MANLFEENSYLKEFKTKIEKINREEKYIKLIDTAFYAKSGGQPGDKGEIIVDDQKIEVLDTIKKDGDIINVLNDKDIDEIKENIKGNVVLLGSIYGLIGQDPDNYDNTSNSENVSYSAIKGGIVNYSRIAASYFGRNGIRVNCICPGGILDKKKNILVKILNFLKVI